MKKQALLQTQQVILEKDPRITVWNRPESREKLEANLLNVHFDAVVLCDDGGGIHQVNARAVEMFGYSFEEFKRMQVLDLIDKASEKLMQNLNKLVDNDQYVMIECNCLRRDQSVFPAEIALGAQRLKDMNDALALFVRDITERKKIEHQLLTVNNALRNAAIGIAVTTRDGSIEFVNPAFLESWGLDLDYRAQGRDIRSFFNDPDELSEILDKVSESYICLHETLALRQDGSTFPAQISVAPDLDAQGGLIGFVMSCKDTTLEQESTELRQRAELKQKENERIRDRLNTVSGLGFAINSPLQLLLSIAEDEDRQDVREQVERIINIVDNLQKEHNPRAFDLEQALSEKDRGEQKPCDPKQALVIDDEDTITRYFSKFINTFYPDITVHIADGGRNGLELFEEHQPGLIILDCAMPEMSGRETFRQIERMCLRNHWELPNVIFNTGFLLDESIRELIERYPGNTLLRKPIKRDDLITALSPYLKT